MLALREERAREDVQSRVDPVLGDIKAATYGSTRPGARSAEDTASAAAGTKYDDSLLKKVVLDRNELWYGPPATFPSREEIERATSDDGVFPLKGPKHFAQNLTSEVDQDLLFKQLPEVSVQYELADGQDMRSLSQAKRDALEFGQSREQVRQAASSEQLQRVLDLRNADAKGIRTVNVRRIVEVFGPAATTPSGGLNTGSSEVQAAVLTHRIRLLAEHLDKNPRDIHNRKSIRTLVHKRASILKYMRKRAMKQDASEGKEEGANMKEYLAFLDRVGLDRRAVEGEVIVR